jgi:hypothetical protein
MKLTYPAIFLRAGAAVPEKFRIFPVEAAGKVDFFP